MRLITGPEELLLRRAATRLVGQLRAEAGGQLEVTDLRATELADGRLPDLRTASLFETPRALVLRDAQQLPAAAARELLELLNGPGTEVAVILLATSTKPIQRLAKRIAELGGRTDVAAPREWEERAWLALVGDELAVHGRTAEPAAIDALLAHAGTDVAGIAEKASQVAAAAAPGEAITAALVEETVVGHGSRGSFAVADALCNRDPAQAVTLLRGCLERGDHPIMILGALVYRLRSLAAVAAKVDPKAVGLSLNRGQAGRLQGLRRNFGPGELTAAFGALAAADLALKSGELPGDLVLERTVLQVATRAA